MAYRFLFLRIKPVKNPYSLWLLYLTMQNQLKSKFLRIPQLFFLTLRFFLKNNLDACASACAFSFIFSFIPILVIIMTVFIRFLHITPHMIDGFKQILKEINPYIDINKIINSLPQGFTFTWGNLFLVVFIIWMARKLFLSVVKGMNQIFHTVAPNRPFVNQFFTFAGEFVIVVLSAVVFFAAFIMRQVLTFPVFSIIEQTFPVIFSTFSTRLVNWTLYAILFLFSAVAYRYCSGTQPKHTLCILCAFLNTAFFYGFIFLVYTFLNKANYNTIYGVLGKIVILLFEVYVFFVSFMFFAQLLFSIQFYKTLLLGELYTLPAWEDGFIGSIRRSLFITPSAIMTKENTIIVEAGKTIFSENENVDCVYYIIFGSVCEVRNGVKTLHYKGTFFGEFEFLLNINRFGSATAITDCQIVKIKTDEFNRLLNSNPDATSKAMSTLSTYTAKIYGRNNGILL